MPLTVLKSEISARLRARHPKYIHACITLRPLCAAHARQCWKREKWGGRSVLQSAHRMVHLTTSGKDEPPALRMAPIFFITCAKSGRDECSKLSRERAIGETRPGRQWSGGNAVAVPGRTAMQRAAAANVLSSAYPIVRQTVCLCEESWLRPNAKQQQVWALSGATSAASASKHKRACSVCSSTVDPTIVIVCRLRDFSDFSERPLVPSRNCSL